MGGPPWIPPVTLTVTNTPAAPPPSPAAAPVVLPAGGADAGDPDATPPHPSALTPDPEHDPETDGEPVEPVLAAGGNRAVGWLLGAALVLFFGSIGLDTVTFLAAQWRGHVLLGAFFSLAVLALTGSAMVLLLRERRRLGRLDDRDTLRREAARLQRDHTFGEAQALLARVPPLAAGDPAVEAALARFHERIREPLGDPEILALYGDQVLPILDDRAMRAIVRNGAAVALLTGLSPLAWLDALLFLWRNGRMIREVAEVYGLRPGLAGSLILTRRSLQGLAMAGVTELAADAATDALGDSVATIVAARAGQGIANGLFMARIGLQAMALCRPIPFAPETRPRLRHIRREVLQALKEAMGGQPRSGGFSNSQP